MAYMQLTYVRPTSLSRARFFDSLRMFRSSFSPPGSVESANIMLLTALPRSRSDMSAKVTTWSSMQGRAHDSSHTHCEVFTHKRESLLRLHSLFGLFMAVFLCGVTLTHSQLYIFITHVNCLYIIRARDLGGVADVVEWHVHKIQLLYDLEVEYVEVSVARGRGG